MKPLFHLSKKAQPLDLRTIESSMHGQQKMVQRAHNEQVNQAIMQQQVQSYPSRAGGGNHVYDSSSNLLLANQSKSKQEKAQA